MTDKCIVCGEIIPEGTQVCQNCMETSPDEDYPCHTCSLSDTCDGWEAQYCCTLCRYYNDDPNCEQCDPMDI